LRAYYLSLFFTMKLSFFSFLFACLCLSTQGAMAQESAKFSLAGNIKFPLADGKVVFSQVNLERKQNQPIDTLKILADGSFQKMYQLEPGIYALNFYGKQEVMLALENAQSLAIQVDGNKKDGFVQVKGSSDTDLLNEYEQFRLNSFAQLITPIQNQLAEAETRHDHSAIATLSQAYAQSYSQHREELSKFVLEKLGTSVAVYATSIRWNGEDDLAFLEKMVEKFQTKRPQLTITQLLAARIKRFKNTQISRLAPEIAQKNPQGNVLTLSDLRGKYVLIDFWASWCRPCRQESPVLVNIYQEYQSKGFEIYSVSLDSKTENWQKAIEKDQLKWLHVSDLQGWQASPAFDYNVTAIPANFLLDKNGKIIAKNLRGKALAEKLKELLIDK
jgi:thiol-disulfide isomerase/thioredoxin